MVSSAIGSGSVLLTANADQLSRGLDKSAKDVGKWGARVQSQAAAVSKGVGAQFAGGIGLSEGIAGALGPAGLGVGLGVASVELVKFAAGVERAAKKTAELNAEALKLTKTLSSVLLGEVERNVAMDANPLSAAAVARSHAVAAQQVADHAREAEALGERYRRLESSIGPAGEQFRKLWTWAGGEYKTDRAKRLFDAAKGQLDASRAGLQAVDAAIERDRERREVAHAAMLAEEQTTLAARGKAVDALTKSLKDQAATFGMTAAQSQIYQLQQAGATESQLAGARAAAVELERVRGRAEAVKAAFRSAFGGATAEAPKFGAALERGSAGAYSAVMRHQFADAGGRMDDRTKTAVEKVEMRVRDLIDVVKERLAFNVG